MQGLKNILVVKSPPGQNSDFNKFTKKWSRENKDLVADPTNIILFSNYSVSAEILGDTIELTVKAAEEKVQDFNHLAAELQQFMKEIAALYEDAQFKTRIELGAS